MLNELYHLSTVLKNEGIQTTLRDKYLRELPVVNNKKPCYRFLVSMNSGGPIISDIDVMEHDLVRQLLKWEPSNGQSFPGLNFQPLYRITDESAKEQLKKWVNKDTPIDSSIIKKIDEWCCDENKNWDPAFCKRLQKCFGVISQELLKRCANIPNQYGAIKILCERVANFGIDDSEEFFQTIRSLIFNCLERENKSSLFPVLIHQGSSAKDPGRDRGLVSVYFDIPISDWSSMGYPVSSKKMMEHINQELLKSSSTCRSWQQQDAFGENGTGSDDTLPAVTLPLLGKVILRAMNHESPCQYRYSTIDSKSFPICEENRKSVAAALDWLAQSERKQRAWGQSGYKEIIFAYPTVISENLPELASLFGAFGPDKNAEARFEDYSRSVIKHLQGLPVPLKDVEIRVFSLRKMDTARTKVIFNRNYSAQYLADAASDWQKGSANIPPMRITVWGEGKGRKSTVSPRTPFPLELARCLNRIWNLSGEPVKTKKERKRIPVSVGIDLLLDRLAAVRHAPYLLNMGLTNGKGLFLSMGNKRPLDKYGQLMPAVLGLLLWKLDIRKEEYMNDAPYTIGRMLKIADDFHSIYCKEVRKGSMPAQLLGNALMMAAMNNPTQALSQLASRIAPYLGWAKTNSTGSAALSRYLLKEFAAIERQLKGVVLPTHLNDAEKAQLLLGYVSDGSEQRNDNNNFKGGNDE